MAEHAMACTDAISSQNDSENWNQKSNSATRLQTHYNMNTQFETRHPTQQCPNRNLSQQSRKTGAHARGQKTGAAKRQNVFCCTRKLGQNKFRGTEIAGLCRFRGTEVTGSCKLGGKRWPVCAWKGFEFRGCRDLIVFSSEALESCRKSFSGAASFRISMKR